MYTVLVLVWWPAPLFGAVIAGTATVKACSAAGLLSDLIDTAVDLHLLDLAQRLHIPTSVSPTAELGKAITLRLTQVDPRTPSVPAQPLLSAAEAGEAGS